MGIASLFLLVSAIYKKDVSVCKGYEIEIIGINNNFFIGKPEILEILESEDNLKERVLEAEDLIKSSD